MELMFKHIHTQQSVKNIRVYSLFQIFTIIILVYNTNSSLKTPESYKTLTSYHLINSSNYFNINMDQ